MDVQHDSASRRGRQRHVAERLVGRQRQRRRVDADHRRRGTRPRLSARRVAVVRLLRRQAAREQSVRREPGLRRSQDRAAEVALPARSPSDLGSRHLVGADPARRDHRRKAAQAGRAADASSRSSTSSTASRASRSGRSSRRRSRRATCPVSGTRRRSRFRASLPAYGRPGLRIPDELIDFTPEMRAQAVENMKRYKWGGDYPVQRHALQPADRRQRQRPARRAQSRERKRWNQLAGRRRGSRDRHRLRASEHVCVHAGIGCAAASRDSRTSRIRPASSGSRSACVSPREPGPTRTSTRGSVPRSKRRLLPTTPAGAQPARAFNAVEGLSMVKPPYGVLSAIDLEKGRAEVAGAARRHARRRAQSSRS